MSANQDIPNPPEDATDREQLLWKELINRMVGFKQQEQTTNSDTKVKLRKDRLVRLRINQTRYSEGDEVDTPEGVGVVVEIRTEDFEGPDGDVEASEDSPAYVVGTQDGASVFRASDLEETTIDADVDNPEQELAGEETANVTANQDTGRTFDYPPSWRKSETPNRLILLKAWAGLGGRHTSCVRELRGEVVSPNRLCASMKDAVLQWEGWRQGG